VDLGYVKESSYSYLSASADQEHEESSNIHSSSTPVDLGYGTESSRIGGGIATSSSFTKRRVWWEE
jgi:hypothetical protein